MHYWFGKEYISPILHILFLLSKLLGLLVLNALFPRFRFGPDCQTSTRYISTSHSCGILHTSWCLTAFLSYMRLLICTGRLSRKRFSCSWGVLRLNYISFQVSYRFVEGFFIQSWSHRLWRKFFSKAFLEEIFDFFFNTNLFLWRF